MAKEDLKLLGLNFTGIYAEKNPDFKTGTINISQNIQIGSIKKQVLTLVKGNALDVDFNFLLNYHDFGKILFKGNLRFLVENEAHLNKITTEWQNKALNEELRNHIATIINHKCSVRALQLEEELDFPIHIKGLLDKISKDTVQSTENKE